MEHHARDSYLSVKVAVVIPLLQAAVSGLLLGSLAAAILWLLGLNTIIVAFTTIVAFTMVVVSLVASAAWISGLRFWREMVSHLDGKIERIPLTSYVEPEPDSVRVELIQDSGRAGSYISLPASPSKLKQLASGLLTGKSFTESSWCGAHGIFTRAEFVQLRDEMYKRGLLALNSPSTPARGYSLTPGGKACIRYLAETTTPLLQSGDDIGGF